MQTEFLLYLLQASACMAAFYGLYRLLLHRETFFVFNRAFILGAVVLSAVLPLVEIAAPEVPLAGMYTFSMDAFTVGVNDEQTSKSLDWAQWLLGIYLTGVLVFSLRLGYRLVWLWKLAHKLPSEQRAGYRLIHTYGQAPTFSFFRWLFWDNSAALSAAEQAQMLRHEETHIRQRHSTDTLLLEIGKIAFWFNPFIYLAQQSLRAVHEYLADREAVRESDPSVYAQLVVAQALSRLTISFIQPFHSFQLKNRITMLRLSKNTKPSSWKIALSMGVVALFSVLYACRSSDVIEPNKSDAVFQVVEQMPEASDAFMKGIQKEIKYPAVARKSNTTGTVFSSFIVHKDGSISDINIVKGVSKELDEEVLRVLKASKEKWSPGLQSDKPVDVRIALPIKFELNQGAGVIIVGRNAAPEGDASISIPDADGVFAVVEEMPQFKGGTKELFGYLGGNITYPAKAREDKVQGTVFVGFVIAADGSIQNPKVLKGVGSGLDEEALRVVQSMPNWEPGKQSGKAVAVRYSLPIKFALGE